MAKRRSRAIQLRGWDLDVEVRPDELEAEESYWTFAVAQRRWWAASEFRRASMAELARGTLDLLAVAKNANAEPAVSGSAKISEELRDSGLVEVVFPRTQAAFGRHMPWEYLIPAAVDLRGLDHPISVVRVLDGAQGRPRTSLPARGTPTILYVQSLPGDLKPTFTFETEEELPLHLVPDGEVWKLEDPTLDDLRAEVRRLNPDIIHIAGMDTHHACIARRDAQDREEWQSPGDVEDGMVLANEYAEDVDVTASALAKALCAADRKPVLVIFNLHNSSAHLPAEAVAAGAGAAVGFQDAVEDEVAEQFLAEFYRMLKRRLDLLPAFVAARKRLSKYLGSMHGTGFALWTAKSRRDEWDDRDEEAFERALRGEPSSRRAPSSADPEAGLQVDIQAYERINYSLLHNRLPLFRKFEIRRSHRYASPLRDVAVSVQLQVGKERFVTEYVTEIGARLTDLRDHLRIPLTWALDEQPTERVQSTLTVTIRHGGSTVFQRPYSVYLQPVDVWIDDDVNRQWLPSFVLPRDEAVKKVISAGQRYLNAIQDDTTAGFDGYQSIDFEAQDPFVGVDAQVQAIWTALIQDFGIRYINPPPTFALMAQRLRSPTDVIRGGRGTCIDLALLLAACLEYIEIFASIILLEGHAFVAYWRSEEGYRDFLDQVLWNDNPDPDLDPDEGLPPEERRTRWGTGAFERVYPWVLGREYYRSIFNAVHRLQQLVPLEATGIPAAHGFWESVDEGTENLRSIQDFHSLIDVVGAREHEVTPLPFGRAS